MNVVEIENFGTCIICPYNKAHVIPAARIQRHLFKCRRQNPKAKIAVCRFNTSHHIPEAELKAHERNCPDRVLVEVYMYPMDSEIPASSKIPMPQAEYNGMYDASGYNPTEEENWDNMDATPYNPEAYCRNNPIVRKATHKTHAEKKKFYEEEQVRITTLLKQREEKK
ncbi:gametocyte-specific factor 1 homolog [Anopheles stephensi]|uniref:gametocyte-specific factor 1 homolog n=1 Tax=Anopheles stephensi TaxID=30069 RepID=UPI0007D0EFAF|nr:gametocyte-specific factor 1 homolog [Anopheles stephensi]XP_035909284.1 gametocyte-specific factor 1 homolog [Anopheles stephensi]XP_035909285.1 gametocyte-specific factor 1 homolog [Anopheles stephensi]XP_035909286.1 gametocyte-specific factor 1 homolog [Anopheles stephensi]